MATASPEKSNATVAAALGRAFNTDTDDARDDEGQPQFYSSHHRQIKGITSRIQTLVKRLYRNKKYQQTELCDLEHADFSTAGRPNLPKKVFEFGQSQSGPESNPVSPRAGADGAVQDAQSEGDSDSSAEMAQYIGFDNNRSYYGPADDYDPEEWDMEASKENVSELLTALCSGQRTEIMGRLNNWMGAKAKEIAGDSDTLDFYEQDCERYAEAFYLGPDCARVTTDLAVHAMERRRFMKMREFHETLQTHRGKRKRFSKSARHGQPGNQAGDDSECSSPRLPRRAPDEEMERAKLGLNVPEMSVFATRRRNFNKDNTFLGMKDLAETEDSQSLRYLTLLKNNLHEKEQEVHTEYLDTHSNGDAWCLLEVLTNQNLELAALERDQELEGLGVKTAREALEYEENVTDLVNLEETPEAKVPYPSAGVGRLIETIKAQVEAQRLAQEEAKKKKSARQIKDSDGKEQTPFMGFFVEPDTKDLATLQNQCTDLRQVIAVIEKKMADELRSEEYGAEMEAQTVQASMMSVLASPLGRSSMGRSSVMDMVKRATANTPKSLAAAVASAKAGAASPHADESGSPKSAGKSPRDKNRRAARATLTDPQVVSKKHEVDVLEQQLKYLDTIMPKAEKTLKTMEEHRVAFMATQKQALEMNFDDLPEKGDNAAENVGVGDSSNAARERRLAAERDEEARLAAEKEKEEEEMMRAELKRLKLLEEETDLRKDVETAEALHWEAVAKVRGEQNKHTQEKLNIQNLEKQIREIAATVDGGHVPHDLKGCKNEVDRLKQDCNLMELKLGNMNSELEDERRRDNQETDLAAEMEAEKKAQAEERRASEERRRSEIELERQAAMAARRNSAERPQADGSSSSSSSSSSSDEGPASPRKKAESKRRRSLTTSRSRKGSDSSDHKGTAKGRKGLATSDHKGGKATERATEATATAASTVASNETQMPGSQTQNAAPEQQQTRRRSSKDATAAKTPSTAVKVEDSGPTAEQEEQARQKLLGPPSEELAALKQENEDLLQQIKETELQVKALKKSKPGKSEEIKQVMAVSPRNKTEAEKKAEEPPVEVLDLRKEVRRKQRELNALRKQWAERSQILRGNQTATRPRPEARRPSIVGQQPQGTLDPVPADQNPKLNSVLLGGGGGNSGANSGGGAANSTSLSRLGKPGRGFQLDLPGRRLVNTDEDADMAAAKHIAENSPRSAMRPVDQFTAVRGALGGGPADQQFVAHAGFTTFEFGGVAAVGSAGKTSGRPPNVSRGLRKLHRGF